MCHHVISSSALTQQQLREVEAVAKVRRSHSQAGNDGEATLWVGSAEQQLSKVQASVNGIPSMLKETHNNDESMPAYHHKLSAQYPRQLSEGFTVTQQLERFRHCAKAGPAMQHAGCALVLVIAFCVKAGQWCKGRSRAAKVKPPFGHSFSPVLMWGTRVGVYLRPARLPT